MTGKELVNSHRARLMVQTSKVTVRKRISRFVENARAGGWSALLFVARHYWFGVLGAHMTVMISTDALAHAAHLAHLALASQIAVFCDVGLLLFESFELYKHEKALKKAQKEGRIVAAE